MSSCQGLHRPPAALRLIVGSVVGLGLQIDLQAVRPRAGRQLPVESGQGRAVGGEHVQQVNLARWEEDTLIKVECAECENTDMHEFGITFFHKYV